MFYTHFRRPCTIPIDSDPDTVIDYRLGINSRGNQELIKVGSHSRRQFIQSFADSTNISTLVERCRLTQDFSPLRLDEMKGQFVDMTLLPKTVREVQQAYNRAADVFERLPADQRSKFGSFERFMDAFSQSAAPQPAASQSAASQPAASQSTGGDS